MVPEICLLKSQDKLFLVAMDTKYQGNTFKMPLVSICTIEILLICLIVNEQIETFRWILEIFLE